MAGLGTAFNLVDWAKRRDPNGKADAVAELLAQTNSILDDMLWKEGNLPTGHRLTVRTGLPTSYWRLLNQGVQPSKSTTAQIDEGCGMLEAWSVLDKDIVELNGDVGGTRLSEASAQIEGMNQEMAQTLFYGNSGLAPEEFNGFAVRYSSLSAANGQNIINAGGVGSDNSSIYLVAWGENTIHGIFPKGSKAGLVHNDLGLDVVDNAAGVTGAKMMAYQDHYQWKCGLAVKDWRYAVRIANIDVSNLVAGSGADLINLMIKAYHRLPSLKLGKPVFYMNRTCFQMLDIQRRDDVVAGGMVYKEVDGMLIPSFRGIPIKIVDQLLETEAVVS